jgi:hypothetical protein
MIDNMGMYQGYNVEGTAKVKVTPEENNTCNTGCLPIYECPIEKCVHREIIHEVPHVCPINTKIINHHIYRHTYSPCYTCTEENEVCNINEGCCNKYM